MFSGFWISDLHFSHIFSVVGSMSEVWVAVDVGSSSLRCSAYQDDRVIASSSVMEPTIRDDGSVDPQIFEWIDRCIGECLEQIPLEHTIVALGFSTLVMNLIGLNEDDEMVHSATYACHSTPVAVEVRQVRDLLPPDRLAEMYQSTGAPLHTAYAIPQLRALSTDGKVRWTTIASEAIRRLGCSGYSAISLSEASWAGLLNVHTCEYDPLALRLIPSCFSLPSIAQEPVLLDQPRWERLAGTRVFAGVGDGACANMGSKCSTPDHIACTIGTSAAARIVLTHVPEAIPEGLFCYRIDRHRLLLGGALTDGGSVIEWLQHLLNLHGEAFDECMQQVEQLVHGDADPVTMVPFLSGERSTGYRSTATGAFLGLTRRTSAADLLFSTMVGVTLRLRDVIRRLQTVSQPRVVVASGKALETNAVWRQMLADCTQLPVVFDSGTEEGTSRGVVRLMQEAMGRAASSELDMSNVCQPRKEQAARWENFALQQDRLLEAITPLYP